MGAGVGVKKRIVVLPGDGIGPEVLDAAVAVLQTVAATSGHVFVLERRPIGGAAVHLSGTSLPQGTLDACRSADAVLLGAVGDPAFDGAPRIQSPEYALLTLRKALGAFANLRPAKLWPGLEEAGPLKASRVAGTDLCFVRELTGGLYFGEPRLLDLEAGEAVNTLRYSRAEITRAADVAFRLARQRRCVVTSVDKANVLETSRLWRSVVSDVAAGFPGVRLEHMYVDACAMALALDPRRFDVVLTENLFGDILSDEAGAVVGSLGLLPSASLGHGPGIYEPVHGSAPALAGKDVANPVGAILSVAMMLRHGFGLMNEAHAIETAVGLALERGARTRDLVDRDDDPHLTCSGMARYVADVIESATPARTA
jgi:3-isopropylmalate dehydrogenase